jgi:nucleoside-diphosphate-sugar epimerase
MTRVLITGSNSFVGVNFRRFSKYRDVEEVSLRDNKPEDIEFRKYDVVLHLAAIVHQSEKISDEEYFKVNRDLCLRVAEESKKAGVKQFVFLSTLKVYGDFINGTGLRNEDSICFPDDAYGKSKYAAEIELRKLEDKNFIVSIIRTPLVYGEDVKANMIKLVKLIDAMPLLPFAGIENKRNFTFAENLVGFIDRIIEKKASGVFIAMDNNALTTSELVGIISGYLGKRVRLFKLPGIVAKLGCVVFPEYFKRLFGSMEFSNKLTLEQLDYKPPYSTREGLKKMTDYYLECKKKKIPDHSKPAIY